MVRGSVKKAGVSMGCSQTYGRILYRLVFVGLYFHAWVA